MQVNVNTGSIRKGFTELAALAAIIVPNIDQVPMPPNLRPVVVAIGGTLLAISHALTTKAVTAPAPVVVAAPVVTGGRSDNLVPSGPPAVAN